MFSFLSKLLSWLNIIKRVEKEAGEIKTKLNPKFKKILLVLLVVALVVAGFIYWQENQRKPEYEFLTIKPMNLTETITASGEVDASQSATLRFQTSGRLAWVGVQEGDRVKKWQALASLDRQELEKKLKQELINYQNQRHDFDQDHEEYQDSIVYNDIKRVLDKNQNNLDRTVLDVEIANLALKYAVLSSPIEGIVTQMSAPTAGVNVTPASSEITISNPEQMVFEAEIDEFDIGKVKPGQAVEIILDAYPNQKISGQINRVGFTPVSTQGGGTAYLAFISLPPNHNQNYKIGMNGDINIVVSEKNQVLAVPFEAINYDNNQVLVKVLKNNQVVSQAVSLGVETDTHVQVTSGLNPGDQVVVSQVN